MKAQEHRVDVARKLRVMPEQKPGRSKQDYGTPADFIAAVEERWGKLAFDLAADESNAKAKRFWTEEDDSLSDACEWNAIAPGKLLWLNPPFGNIGPWAAKCAEYAALARARRTALDKKGRLLFLTPASVGANWYAAHVHDQARVVFLNGRLCFDGKDPYPKDCMLSVFGEPPGFEIWRWK